MKWLPAIIGLFIFLYGILSLFVYFYQEKLIFYPEKLPRDYAFRFSHAFVEHFFVTDTGTVINALHFHLELPKGVVLYFHGNMGSLRTWGDASPPFLDLGYDVLVFDYRGYGKSTGNISEEGLYHDALFLYDRLAEQYGEGRIVVYGRSIGSGIAVNLSSHRHPAKLVLEAPLYSMKDLVRRHFPWLPVFLLRYRFRSDLAIGETACPVAIFHGTDDEVIPYESALKLVKHAKPGDLFFPIEGGRHNDLSRFPGYRNTLAWILGGEGDPPPDGSERPRNAD
ncbi:MAG: alpha/beta hydrolase [Spirochaetales bacterium]|nr:alpha/beta hydrolase [Spirochaetales bacterium]